MPAFVFYGEMGNGKWEMGNGKWEGGMGLMGRIGRMRQEKKVLAGFVNTILILS
jgi:hypothetical protein